ncbi:MAG: SAM-dependent methyltransferase [Bdellovibrionales bacterium]|nr:SAM-dependent methyltransferase [Bdellovibrionales bacterium]
MMGIPRNLTRSTTITLRNKLSQLPQSSGNYSQEKHDSEGIDLALGFQVDAVEAALGARPLGAQVWGHLSSQVFQTPYAEILRILQDLAPKPGDLVVDLGAAYGRMGFVVEAFFPQVRFLGYECSAERVAEAQRVMELYGLSLSQMVPQNLEAADFEPEKAQHYFLYDFGTREAISKTLLDLKKIARGGSIQVAARGRASRDAIEREHPWLSQVNPARHSAHTSIYRS